MLCTKGALFNYYTTEKLDMVMVFLEMNIKKKYQEECFKDSYLLYQGALFNYYTREKLDMIFLEMNNYF